MTAAFQHLLNAELLHPKIGDTKIKHAAIRVNGRGMGPGSKFFEGKAAILDFAAALENPLSPFSVVEGIPNPAGEITEKIEAAKLAFDLVTTSPADTGGGEVTESARSLLNQFEKIFNLSGPFEAYTIVQYETYQSVPFLGFFSRNEWVPSAPVITEVKGSFFGGFAGRNEAASAATSALKAQLSGSP